MRVKNEGKAIEMALNLDADSVKHIGNFLFKGTLNGQDVLVYAEPMDEEQDTLNVYAVKM